MSKTIENVSKKVKEIITKMGYELEYVENMNENKNNIIRIVIDKNGQITTEDCEKVSHAVEDEVDNIVAYKEGYILEISSPGLERRLVNIGLYEKYKGQKIHIKLYKPKDGLKEFEALLINVDKDDIEVQIDGKKMKINITEIALANTVCNI